MTSSTEASPASANAVLAAHVTPAKRNLAVMWGLLGVLCFSMTLPATHIAIPAFGSVGVGLGRAVVAAVLAGVVLLVRREPLPPRHTWAGLAQVALGVVVGFPLFSSLALQGASVAHSAVINALLPAATAVIAVGRAGERPAPLFWLSCAAGTVAVLIFALVQGGGHFHVGDFWMIAAVSLGALGYAEGGRLAREMDGWRVICWALIIAAPFVVIPAVWSFTQHAASATPQAWVSFAYVSVFSMLLGFFAWYRGLAQGGIARIGQLQLVQPLLTILWAALLLGERLTLLTGLTALLVVACVAVGQRIRQNVKPTPPKESLSEA